MLQKTTQNWHTNLRLQNSRHLPLFCCCLSFLDVSFNLLLFLGFSLVDLTGISILTEYHKNEDSFVQMILPAKLLRHGSKYRFKLTVNDGSKEGVASIVVEVRTGPTSGSFAVEPTSVKALDTVTLTGKYSVVVYNDKGLLTRMNKLVE